MRGHKAGLLTVPDYNNLCQCETLDDIKLHLVGVLMCGVCGPRLSLCWSDSLEAFSGLES